MHVFSLYACDAISMSITASKNTELSAKKPSDIFYINEVFSEILVILDAVTPIEIVVYTEREREQSCTARA